MSHILLQPLHLTAGGSSVLANRQVQCSAAQCLQVGTCNAAFCTWKQVKAQCLQAGCLVLTCSAAFAPEDRSELQTTKVGCMMMACTFNANMYVQHVKRTSVGRWSAVSDDNWHASMAYWTVCKLSSMDRLTLPFPKQGQLAAKGSVSKLPLLRNCALGL